MQKLAIILTIAIAMTLLSSFGLGDACRYFLRVPADMDIPDTPPFDTTIVRTTACREQLIWFPSGGTETKYIVRKDTIERTLHFFNGQTEKQWLNVADLPSGTYDVSMFACGNGGSFTLRLAWRDEKYPKW
jgi:hypothetical protein